MRELELLCNPPPGNDENSINIHSLPTTVYKYFSDIKHANNFLQGNIWIPGVSQNKLCADPSEYISIQKELCSPTQILTKISSQIHTLSLSLSHFSPNETTIPTLAKDYDSCVEIELYPFIKAIRKDLYSSTAEHKVLLFRRTTLLQKIEEKRKSSDSAELIAFENTIRNISDIPEIYDKLQFDISLDNIRPISYDKKYNGLESARNKGKRFLKEGEIRVEFGHSSFLNMDGENFDAANPFSAELHNLIQHIKLNCPSAVNFCRLIPLF